MYSTWHQGILPIHQWRYFDKWHPLCKTAHSIDDKDLRLIMHCRKSLPFFDNKNWKKNSTETCFDVTMGSIDGAEICEFVGLYIQWNLENILPKTNFGLYRDEELIL